MYGRPYGKSLCHAWGASPLYLLGRYFLGIEPTKAGYREFSVHPVLGGLDWMEGSVPTPQGTISVRMDRHSLRVRATQGSGYLTFRSTTPPACSLGHAEKTAPGLYRLWIDTPDVVTVSGSFG